MLRRLVETYAVENKKFRLGAEERLVGKPGGLHIRLRSFRHVPRIAVIGLLRQRVRRIPDHHQRRRIAERIDERSVRIRHQQHVRFVDRSPSPNRAGIEPKAFLEGFFVQFADRIADVLPDARHINKSKIENLRVVFLCKFKHAFCVHSLSLRD